MSRTKGYKCFNIKCGSCIGKTLCGEPEDTALVCVDRVIGKPMTNADRIRAMTDEALALWICGIYDIEEEHEKFINGIIIPGYAPHDIEEWLQMPAEEDKHEAD